MIRDEDLKIYVDYSEGQKQAAHMVLQLSISTHKVIRFRDKSSKSPD